MNRYKLIQVLAAQCFIDHEIFISPGSVSLLERFDEKAMRLVTKNIRFVRERHLGIHSHVDRLISRLISLKEKSLPFLREAVSSDDPGIAEEAVALLRQIE